MTKTELLARTKDGGELWGTMLDLARTPLSEQEAATRYARAIKAAARWANITKIVDAAVFLMIALGLIGHVAYLLTWRNELTAEDVVLRVFYSASLVLIVRVLASAIMLVARELAGYKYDVEWLAPLAGTSLCERGLQNLQDGGPEVQAWRDLALKERDQLRRFDYEVMSSLKQAYDAENRAKQEQARQDAACRALHGLPTAPPAQT